MDKLFKFLDNLNNNRFVYLEESTPVPGQAEPEWMRPEALEDYARQTAGRAAKEVARKGEAATAAAQRKLDQQAQVVAPSGTRGSEAEQLTAAIAQIVDTQIDNMSNPNSWLENAKRAVFALQNALPILERNKVDLISLTSVPNTNVITKLKADIGQQENNAAQLKRTIEIYREMPNRKVEASKALAAKIKELREVDQKVVTMRADLKVLVAAKKAFENKGIIISAYSKYLEMQRVNTFMSKHGFEAQHIDPLEQRKIEVAAQAAEKEEDIDQAVAPIDAELARWRADPKYQELSLKYQEALTSQKAFQKLGAMDGLKLAMQNLPTAQLPSAKLAPATAVSADSSVAPEAPPSAPAVAAIQPTVVSPASLAVFHARKERVRQRAAATRADGTQEARRAAAPANAPEKITGRTDAQRVDRTKELIGKLGITWDNLVSALDTRFDEGADKKDPSVIVAVIKSLQEDVGLSGNQVDGIFGKQTFGKLEKSKGYSAIVAELRGAAKAAEADVQVATPEKVEPSLEEKVRTEQPAKTMFYATWKGAAVSVVDFPRQGTYSDKCWIQTPDGGRYQVPIATISMQRDEGPLQLAFEQAWQEQRSNPTALASLVSARAKTLATKPGATAVAAGKAAPRSAGGA